MYTSFEMKNESKYSEVYDDRVYSYWWVPSKFYGIDDLKDRDRFKTHLFLEFLDYLGILKYYKRDHEGTQFEIIIDRRKRR